VKEYHVRPVNSGDEIVHRIIFNGNGILLAEKHMFMIDNYPNHYCIEHGYHYIVYDAFEIDMVMKLRW